jgi:hypothetical protein
LLPDDDNAYGTSGPPALAVFKDKLYCIHEGRDNSGWLWCATFDGLIPSKSEKLEKLLAYAPRVWLAEGEEYFPCSIEWAFQYLYRYRNDDGRYWLNTKQNLSSPSDDSLPLFAGNLSSAPIYAFWVPKSGGYFDLIYFMYYGYNRGKKVLDTIWGNHVSDWEHITVRLNSNLQPQSVKLSQHSDSEEVIWSDIIKLNTHPVVYSAWGSHGLYKESGDHIYNYLVYIGGLSERATDSCSEGTVWDTWNQVEAYDFGTKEFIGNVFKTQSPENELKRPPSVKTWPSWMSTDYTAPGLNPADPASGPIFRWGNPKDGCTGESVIGECRLNWGPTGPIDKGDCWDCNKFA